MKKIYWIVGIAVLVVIGFMYVHNKIDRTYDDDLEDPSMCYSVSDTSCTSQNCASTGGEWVQPIGCTIVNGETRCVSSYCKCPSPKTWAKGFGCDVKDCAQYVGAKC